MEDKQKSCWDAFRGRAAKSDRHVRAVKRELDREATLLRYEKRMQNMPDSNFEEIDNSFLSTFDCYCNILEDLPNTKPLCNNAVVLMRVARSKGVNIIGVTSERSEKGTYCVDLPEPYMRGVTKVVYVGKFNYFTNNKSSKWRLLPQDKVFKEVIEF